MSESEKAELRDAVMQARDLGLLATISFDAGRDAPAPEALAELREKMTDPEMKERLKDASLVLVVLGFADIQGTGPDNARLSMARAESVRTALKEQCGVLNRIHVIPMGATTSFDPHDYAKNRVVEVWAGKP
jgi:outer membrane protein OmpA-like peptidoglycan-associated protein